MADKFETLVTKIMKECEQDGEPVTRAEAEEMAKMEIGAKDIKMDARVDAPKAENAEKRKRTVKYSDEKVRLFTEIKEFLTENYENIVVVKENGSFSLELGEKSFNINIVEHRPPKK